MSQHIVNSLSRRAIFRRNFRHRIRNIRPRPVGAMGPTSLHMCRTSRTMGQQRRIHTNHTGDFIHQRQQLVELLRRDTGVLCTRIRDHLVLIHLLIRIQNLLCLDTLRRQLRRQTGEVNQLWRRRRLHRFFITGHTACPIHLWNRRLIRKLGLIRIRIYDTVFIPEPVLIIRDFLILAQRLERVPYYQNHSRLQPALTKNTAAIAVFRSNTGKLHRQIVKLAPVKRLHIIRVTSHTGNHLSIQKCLLNLRRRFVHKIHP